MKRKAGNKMYTYLAIYKGTKKEVQAESSYKAQILAASLLKAKKSYEVTVILLTVIHSTSSI